MGYESMTTLKIAEEAGINEASLFRKYGSKKNLFIRSIDWSFENASLRKVKFTGDVQADLVVLFRLYDETYTSLGRLIPRLVLETRRKVELLPAFRVMKENQNRVAELFRQYQNRGILSSELPAEALMNSFIGPLYSAGMGVGIDHALYSLSDGDLYVRHFLDGYRQ